MKGEPKCSSCVSPLSGKPSKLIRSELHKLDGHLLHSEDIRFVAQSLYRARRKIHSSLPKSREDVHNAIELMDTRKSKDEEFVITNDVPSGLIIFSCSSDLEFLTNSAEEIFVDGTFSFCPKFVYQLYTIHRFRNGRFVLLLVALLSGKSDSVQKYVRHNQRCLERPKETELAMPLHNLASIVPVRLPDWIILNLWGTVSVCQDRYVNDSSFIDFALFKLGLLYLLMISALSFSPLMNI
jgi:hypothetical protein